ncbi:MAG: metallophosphoesterase [Bacteroidales bacterium]|nr:metallophosphoesterase [Bacteroidales bacterium]
MKVDVLTIAHVSDLHRSNDNPISNAALLNSLIRDMDTYITQGISKPDLLIISGDVIQGDANIASLKGQYVEALDFLKKLANVLFGGDKSKIILIPGNHDITWTESRKSMEKIEEKEITDDKGDLRHGIYNEAIKINSNVKWSWADRSFYRITDEKIYQNRLSFFCDFYQQFYDGNRIYSLDPNKQFDFFDFPELAITIVGFNSCFHNDHLNRAGSINPVCIANVGLKLRTLEKQGRLILATWHHNTKGAPYDQDYMDDTFIKNLISNSVKIGFHGHQHKQEILREVNNIIDGKIMLILSAGSLCADPDELPTGYNQQYNLLELSRINDEEIQFKLFSRVKTPESSFDNPIWEKGTINTPATEFTTKFNHSKPPIPDIRKAERLLCDKDYQRAHEILKQHDLDDPFVRILLLECYEQLENYLAIIKHFSDPKNSAECISLINASIEDANIDTVKKVLSIKIIVDSIDPSVIHLRNQLKGKLK